MPTLDSKSARLTSQRNELIKSYTTFNVDNLPEFIYTAPTDAAVGDPCTVVQYEYQAPGSAIVAKMKESNGTWPVGADI